MVKWQTLIYTTKSIWKFIRMYFSSSLWCRAYINELVSPWSLVLGCYSVLSHLCIRRCTCATLFKSLLIFSLFSIWMFWAWSTCLWSPSWFHTIIAAEIDKCEATLIPIFIVPLPSVSSDVLAISGHTSSGSSRAWVARLPCGQPLLIVQLTVPNPLFVENILL